eukprot:COSAG06_NODE_82_length_25183_cov_133.214240_14_plen_53_part_00
MEGAWLPTPPPAATAAENARVGLGNGALQRDTAAVAAANVRCQVAFERIALG